MNTTARLYHCARCHCQVVICRHCDRGNVYCGEGCAKPARTETLRRAGSRYQSSRRGRHSNAERQRRYRERQREKVTQQGSSSLASNDLLSIELSSAQNVSKQDSSVTKTTIYCHFCHCECSQFLRLDFLRPPTRYRTSNKRETIIGYR